MQLPKYTGLEFDALSAEEKLAALLGYKSGERGRENDADVLRSGDHGSVARLLEVVADRIEARARLASNWEVRRTIPEQAAGLRKFADDIREVPGREQDDYYLLIVSHTLYMVHTLLSSHDV
jgi:hypothetical protein